MRPRKEVNVMVNESDRIAAAQTPSGRRTDAQKAALAAGPQSQNIRNAAAKTAKEERIYGPNGKR